MAKNVPLKRDKRKPSIEDAPKTLDDHIFFGLKLDEEQKIFRDAIWNPDIDIVFCNAKAGCGKTLISAATALLLKEYDRVDAIEYMTAAGVHEHKQGLLPGTLEQKSYFSTIPFRQALITLGYDPERIIRSEANLDAQKEGTAFVIAQTDSYIRGINISSADERTVLILDESQNMKEDALRTALTRVSEGGRVIVIGHEGQCDLKDPRESGFVKCLEHFRGQERCEVCTLSTNHRGWISAWADEPW